MDVVINISKRRARFRIGFDWFLSKHLELVKSIDDNDNDNNDNAFRLIKQLNICYTH